MFEPQFLGQVRVAGVGVGARRGLGQSQSQPSPSSSDSRFAVPAADQNFVPPLSPFMVPFMTGYDFPPQYPPERFNCVLNGDGLSWTCTPKVSAPALVWPAYPPYPVYPGPFGPFGY